VQDVLEPVTHLPFINADEIAALDQRRSFITETVFSHPSKIELIRQGVSAGYLVTLHAILVPEDVTVMRVEYRVARGGHTVPETKVRERYRRLWTLLAQARDLAGRSTFYDNGRASAPFLPIANYGNGRLVGDAAWPAWTPSALIRR
jgi:predicted ABC-type ATPase